MLIVFKIICVNEKSYDDASYYDASIKSECPKKLSRMTRVTMYVLVILKKTWRLWWKCLKIEAFPMQERANWSQNSFLGRFLKDEGKDGGSSLLRFGYFSVFGNDAMFESGARSLFFWYFLKNFYFHFSHISLDIWHEIFDSWILLAHHVDKIFVESFICPAISCFLIGFYWSFPRFAPKVKQFLHLHVQNKD